MLTNKRLINIFIVVFVDILGFSSILPLLPYYATSFNASGSTTGFVGGELFGLPVFGRRRRSAV
ncbi:MAG: hypothetical protein IPM55_14215 [Acidobacteria bacterium]|nr:hypothetical protein [Acidobacteriota bacterium]